LVFAYKISNQDDLIETSATNTIPPASYAHGGLSLLVIVSYYTESSSSLFSDPKYL